MNVFLLNDITDGKTDAIIKTDLSRENIEKIINKVKKIEDYNYFDLENALKEKAVIEWVNIDKNIIFW